MAEPSPAAVPPVPLRDDGVHTRAFAMLPAPDEMPPDGQPIADPPPLVELVDPPIEPAALRAAANGLRPVRRKFLAPSTREITRDNDGPPPLAHLRPRIVNDGALAPPPREATPPFLAAPTADAAPARHQGGSRRRTVAVAAGVMVALAVAVAIALQPRLDADELARLPMLAWQRLVGPPAVSATGEPPADPARRVSYYGERARAGDASAQLALAILYAKGDGVEQDYTLAAKWFRAAAAAGVMRAQYDLGVLYERGRGVPLDYPQAVAWYRKAAEQNHPLAQYNLAVAFTKGQGVRRDFIEAAVWYHRAAAQGVVAAMVNLAILYERGEGVETSTVDAYAWYRAAARRGSQPAARRAEELLQAFASAEQSRAQAKTADINASIRDAIGDRARLAAKNPPPATPTAADDSAPPILKSGIERHSGGAPRAEARAENP